MSKQSDQDLASIHDLLSRLRGRESSRAWTEFLHRYSSLVLHVAKQYAFDSDQAEDCFLYVCEALIGDEAKRLNKFDARHGSSFKTWLITIVTNLCIDWHRSFFGRQAMPAAIQKMPDLEQWAYRCRVEQGLDLQTCLVVLRNRFPDLSREQLSRAMASIHNALSPKQRWRLASLAQRNRPANVDNYAPDRLRERSASPREFAQQVQQRKVLNAALSRLTSQQRLLLRLRFEQDLTLAQVARIAGLGDLHQARRAIESALSELRNLMETPDS